MKQIFINLPVASLEKSKSFYTQIGFMEYPLFSGKNQVCMAWSAQILLMLQTKNFFNLGKAKSIADTKNNLSASFTLPIDTLDKVNEIMESGLSAGGKEAVEMIDKGFMQLRSIEDIDGHIWSLIYLDIEKFKNLKENQNKKQ